MTNVNELIGKRFEMTSINDTVLVSFIINHAKIVDRDSILHPDGSVTPRIQFLYVSDNGVAWYHVRGGIQDRIVNN